MHLFNILLAALALTLATAIPVPTNTTNDGEDGDTGDDYVQCLAQCNGNSTPCLTNAKNDDSTVLGVTFMWYVLSCPGDIPKPFFVPLDANNHVFQTARQRLSCVRRCAAARCHSRRWSRIGCLRQRLSFRHGRQPRRLLRCCVK